MLSSVLRKCKYPFRSRKFSTKEVKTHSAYIFGDNTYNQCNNTNQKSINKPFKLELNNVNIKSIESGFTHSFFLTGTYILYIYYICIKLKQNSRSIDSIWIGIK